MTTAALLLMLASQTDQPPAKDPPPSEMEKLVAKLAKMEAFAPDAKDGDLRKKQKERFKEAVTQLNGLLYLLRVGSIDPVSRYKGESVVDCWKKVVRSGLEVLDRPEDRLILLQGSVTFLKGIEDWMERAQRVGGPVAPWQVSAARYDRLDAEIELLRATEKAKKKKK